MAWLLYCGCCGIGWRLLLQFDPSLRISICGRCGHKKKKKGRMSIYCLTQCLWMGDPGVVQEWSSWWFWGLSWLCQDAGWGCSHLKAWLGLWICSSGAPVDKTVLALGQVSPGLTMGASPEGWLCALRPWQLALLRVSDP